ncbi:hypothetical protein F7725_003629 [Dissostichus mawsoni]|uniref:Uncharacterized protein n=1 Tax=Dissostichus mawsoni TaxID=36200 RepID=A0A7J5YC68_DISMA|nr:hypothetical protein F7725_003629 [Dissostichus mawsoni]
MMDYRTGMLLLTVCWAASNCVTSLFNLLFFILLTGRGGQRTEDTQFTMMDYRTGLLLLTVCWAGQCSIRKEESMQNSDISPSTYVTAERRTEDRGHTV